MILFYKILSVSIVHSIKKDSFNIQQEFVMKKLMVGLALLYPFTVTAQSPGLTINVLMDSIKADGIRYKIEMKICKPKKMTQRGDWFSHDTSIIDFASLKTNDIDCGEYFDKGTPILISGEEKKPPFNQFEFSNQVFAWERIYIFRISNSSSRGWLPEMYVVLPIKYKSFRTSVDLTGIEFQSGKVLFLTDVNAAYTENTLLIQQSLKGKKTVEVKTFPLKELLGKN